MNTNRKSRVSSIIACTAIFLLAFAQHQHVHGYGHKAVHTGDATHQPRHLIALAHETHATAHSSVAQVCDKLRAPQRSIHASHNHIHGLCAPPLPRLIHGNVGTFHGLHLGDLAVHVPEAREAGATHVSHNGISHNRPAGHTVPAASWATASPFSNPPDPLIAEALVASAIHHDHHVRHAA